MSVAKWPDAYGIHHWRILWSSNSNDFQLLILRALFSKPLLMSASVSTCNNSHTCIFNFLEKYYTPLKPQNYVERKKCNKHFPPVQQILHLNGKFLFLTIFFIYIFVPFFVNQNYVERKSCSKHLPPVQQILHLNGKFLLLAALFI